MRGRVPGTARQKAPRTGKKKKARRRGTPQNPEMPGANEGEENAAWQQAQRQAEKVRQTVANWLREQENVQRDYPGFSLEEALKDPDFARLVRAGVSMRRAYEAVHLPEILYDAMRRAAREGESRAAEMIRQRGKRPAGKRVVAHRRRPGEKKRGGTDAQREAVAD